MTGELFAPKPKPAPVILPPATAPTPTGDDEAIRKAKKKEMLRNAQRGGRASTMLSESTSETLG